MKIYLILLAISLISISKNERHEIKINDDNLTLVFNYNKETSLLDDNPLDIKILNSSNDEIKINSINIEGDIDFEKNANINKSYKRFHYHNKLNTILLNKNDIKLKERFEIEILNEISELYINNENIHDGNVFFNFTVSINFNDDKTLKKNIAIPYKVNSLRYNSDCDSFFQKQYLKYHDYWFASGYLKSLIDNKDFLRQISTKTLAWSIRNFRKEVNRTTDINNFKILSEIKARNLNIYKELSDLGYSKGHFFRENVNSFIMQTGNVIYVNKNFEWDNEYFLIVIDHYNKGGFRKSPKEILDQFKDEWGTNQKYLKLYYSTFN
ncbi:hypothetical protein ACJRPK_17365 [Aquimarina sp. 2-A2]|uniref:hypothetical protein n=1 Tax=Aquimarina sp. 2-A2 TaxID=3382644 RepID=UPI00387EECFA